MIGDKAMMDHFVQIAQAKNARQKGENARQKGENARQKGENAITAEKCQKARVAIPEGRMRPRYSETQTLGR